MSIFSFFSKPTSSKLTPDLIKSHAKNYLTGYLSKISDSLFGKVGMPKDTTELDNNMKIRDKLNKLINMAINEYVDSKSYKDKDLQELQEYVNLKSSNQQPNQHSIETGLIEFINKTDYANDTDDTDKPVNATNDIKYKLIIDRIKEVDATESKGGKRKSMRNRKSKRTKKSKKNRRRTNRRH